MKQREKGKKRGSMGEKEASGNDSKEKKEGICLSVCLSVVVSTSKDESSSGTFFHMCAVHSDSTHIQLRSSTATTHTSHTGTT